MHSGLQVGVSQAAASADSVEKGKHCASKEALHATWQREWEGHRRKRNTQRSQRRAVLTLALIAEPLQLQWGEVLQDTTFLAWKDAVSEAHRSKAQSVEQQRFEEALEIEASNSRVAALPSDPGAVSISAHKLEILLQELDDTVTLGETRELLASFPCSQDGHIFMKDVLCWLFDVSLQELASWHHDWKIHHTGQMQRHLRRRAILALGLLAEPLQRQWEEAYLDIMFSAWVEQVTDSRRALTLSLPRCLYERTAKAQESVHRSMSLQLEPHMPGETTPAVEQEPKYTLSCQSFKCLTEEQFQTVVSQVAPTMAQAQVDLLLRTVPRSHCGSIPVDGLMAWIRGDSV